MLEFGLLCCFVGWFSLLCLVVEIRGLLWVVYRCIARLGLVWVALCLRFCLVLVAMVCVHRVFFRSLRLGVC